MTVSQTALWTDPDPDSEASLQALSERQQIVSNRVPGVRTVLVVLSARALVFDVEALRNKIFAAYPDATVSFCTTSGKPIGPKPIRSVDLLIDFTGPGQRPLVFFFLPMRWRRMARVAVGRDAGPLRRRLYDRIFNERASELRLPSDFVAREAVVQKKVLALAGVAFVPVGDATPDLARKLALELPPLRTE